MAGEDDGTNGLGEALIVETAETEGVGDVIDARSIHAT
jgi:hypothetical protein